MNPLWTAGKNIMVDLGKIFSNNCPYGQNGGIIITTQFSNVNFKDWEVVKKLGEGSFGGVYEIRRTLPSGCVEKSALKKLTVPKNKEEIQMLYSQSFSKENISEHYKDQMRELVSEYSLMQKVNSCRNIVTCHDVQCIPHDDGIGWDIYIRMELLKPLKKVLSTEYQELTVLKVGLSLCNALLACQEHNIIHRDIKPENILVSPKGEYKLGDFGIAKISEGTTTGTMTGTMGYIAPEVANRWHYGFSADIYSLGMVLYWMMNEQTLPFLPLPPQIPTAAQRQEAVNRRVSGDSLPLPVNGSKQLKQIIMKACAFSVKDRYQSVMELKRDLYVCYRHQRTNSAENNHAVILKELGLSEDALNPHITRPSTQQRRHQNSPPDKAANKVKTSYRKYRIRVFPIVVAIFCALTILGLSAIAIRAISTPKLSSQIATQGMNNGEDIYQTLAFDETVLLPNTPKTGGKMRDMVEYWSMPFESKATGSFVRGILRSEVQTITFLDTLALAPADANDLSEACDRSVLGWVTGTAGSYDMFIAGDGGVVAPKDCRGLFADYTNLQTIDFRDCFYTFQTEYMSFMFSSCERLTNLDLSCFDTSHVISMNSMFSFCEDLESCDLSNFDTSHVIDMSSMFNICESLKSLDLSRFDTSQVTDMSNMFCECERIMQLDVSSFDTSQVTDMSWMFTGCQSLESLDLRNFDTSQVNDMSNMFGGCTYLTSLNVSSFDTSQVTNMNSMFNGCNNLESLDISCFNTSLVSDMSGMFGHCFALKEIDLSSFDTSKVTDMVLMFRDCGSLTELDLSGFDTSKVTNMNFMFQNCSSLDSIQCTDSRILDEYKKR